MHTQDYFLPDNLGLTPECKALLKQLLHPDQHQRISTQEILANPWFATDLPTEALTMNERYAAMPPPAWTQDGESSAPVCVAECS